MESCYDFLADETWIRRKTINLQWVNFLIVVSPQWDLNISDKM